MKRAIKSSFEPHDNSNYTRRLLEMISDGIISAENVLNELLQYLPKSYVEEFASDYLDLDEDEADEDDIYSAEVIASSDIDALLSAAGGRSRAIRLIKDTKRNYPGIDDDELAEMLENRNDSLSSDEWLSVVEYLDN